MTASESFTMVLWDLKYTLGKAMFEEIQAPDGLLFCISFHDDRWS